MKYPWWCRGQWACWDNTRARVNFQPKHFKSWAAVIHCKDSCVTPTGESWIHISTLLGIEPSSLMTGSKGWPTGPVDCVWLRWDSRLSTGLPPSSRLCRLWSWKEDLQGAWNRDRRALWDQVGLSYCRHDSLVTVRDKARLRRGHNDQSRQGHQCSETTEYTECWPCPLFYILLNKYFPAG